MTVQINGTPYVVEVEDVRGRPIIVVVDGERFEVWPEADVAAPTSRTVALSPGGLRGARAATSVGPQPAPQVRRTDVVSAPLPGVVRTIAVREGTTVSAGQELCVIEAMKMKNAIHAPRDGRIAAVHVTAGQHVRHGDALVTYAE